MRKIIISFSIIVAWGGVMTVNAADWSSNPVKTSGASAAAVSQSATFEKIPTGSALNVSDSSQLVIADFNKGEKPNNLNGDYGAWNKDPGDATQGCDIAYEKDDALGSEDGSALQINYDVESPNPAYNGIWMKLNGQNASAYNTLTFYVRGEGWNNFTKRIKLELKDASETSPYMIAGITDKWRKIEVPFKQFRKIKDWSSLSELVIVFDDINSSPKQGTVLIDQIAFEKK
jgi:hypothetical protein